MEKIEKDLVKKEKEIEKLKQKFKEEEEKYKREQSRKSEEIKELENRVKELLKEKKDVVIRQEQVGYEKEKMIKQIADLHEDNKRLREELNRVGFLKAEISSLKLKSENQSRRISELELAIKSRDVLINELKLNEFQLREGIQTKMSEITRKESEIDTRESEKITISQSLDLAQDSISDLKKRIDQLHINIDNQKAEIDHSNAQIKRLENEKNQLNVTIKEKEAEISKLSDKITNLLTKNSELEKEIVWSRKGIEEAESGIISKFLPNLVKGSAQAKDRIIKIAQNIKHNAVLSIPEFDVISEILNLENIRPSTQIRIMAHVDFKNPIHKAIFDQYNHPNILIRHNDEKNLWGILRDQEELLIAPVDSSGIPVGLIVKDPFPIKILGNLLLDNWGKCRKNVSKTEFIHK